MALGSRCAQRPWVFFRVQNGSVVVVRRGGATALTRVSGPPGCISVITRFWLIRAARPVLRVSAVPCFSGFIVFFTVIMAKTVKNRDFGPLLRTQEPDGAFLKVAKTGYLWVSYITIVKMPNQCQYSWLNQPYTKVQHRCFRFGNIRASLTMVSEFVPELFQTVSFGHKNT